MCEAITTVVMVTVCGALIIAGMGALFLAFAGLFGKP